MAISTFFAIILAQIISISQAQNFSHISQRIIGGEIAPADGFPFMVSLQNFQNSGTIRSKFCSSSVIDSNWLITAAHCFPPSRANLKFTAVFGITNLQESTWESTVQRNFTYSDVKKYPGFAGNLYSVKNDIALIKIQPPVEFNEKIQPIKLPTPDLQPTEGSPVQNSNGILEGLISWTGPPYPCGSLGQPVVCTQVSKFVNWINEEMSK